MLEYKNASLSYDIRVEDLLARMTLSEKIGQLCQSPMLDYNENKSSYLEKVRQGQWGSRILADTAWAGNAPGESVDPNQINEIQRVAVEESRLGIPVIFARDVIYGQSTVLPIPLAQAASWNPELVREAYEAVAREAASLGINWTFAPMLDIVRDPRWGRVIESSGEDPYLASQFAKSVVNGFQGDDPSHPERLLACAKHFIGYGAAEGGRDYETTEITDNTLHNVYLPPFKAAVESGVATLMTGFNDLGGTPTTSAKPLIRSWLKGQQAFDGMVVSDWGSISDLAYFGVTDGPSSSAERALDAGVDMAMTHEAYSDHLEGVIAEKPALQEQLDDAVRRVLLAKFRAGLFENPYADPELHKSVLRHPEHVDKALNVAQESMVLLKNNNAILPLSNQAHKVAVIGPHAHSKRQHLGSWCLDGEASDVTSIAEGIKKVASQVEILTDSDAFSDEMVECARRADVVVLCVGESHRRTGEARNIAELSLPAGQEELIEAIAYASKPLIVVQCTGRPVPSKAIERYADALLYAWQSGTETGEAVARILFGEVSPSGKLPMTVPRSTGQIPVYYGRKQIGKKRDFLDYMPYKDEQESPLYPFGFGLSYSHFSYSDLRVQHAKLVASQTQKVSVIVENIGTVKAAEVAQCYIRRKVASTTRPLRELKGFNKVELEPGEKAEVVFELTSEDLAFYGNSHCLKNELGEIELYVGGSSEADLAASFTVI
ncbi:glycoside hydrolase family 3 N-terminal domain-containing protein [Vibrio astriarenae]|uniref:glycoside hydrolase family 3 N-terminal domain-containing protein n=1 Tax=Vibrio astriarenae TaxID=1481923 RepID=UPI003735DA29